MNKQLILIGDSPELKNLYWSAPLSLRIGSDQKNSHVYLSEDTIKDTHAEIVQMAREWLLWDLDTSMGTFLNGNRVLPQTPEPLQNGDRIDIGRFRFRVSMVLTDPDIDADSFSPSRSEDRFQVKAISRTSRTEAIEAVTADNLSERWQSDHLRALLRTGCAVCDVASLDQMLEKVLTDVVTSFQAQRGSILLLDPMTQELRVKKSVVTKHQLKKGAFSRAMASRSVEAGESLLCADVSREKALSTSQSITSGSMSSIICALLRAPRRHLGVLHLDRGPLQPAFTTEEFQIADAIAATLSGGIESALLVEQQREAFVRTVSALAQLLELRDSYTANHTTRVTRYAEVLAEALGASQEALTMIRVGAPLHDIGKIGISDAILHKPGKLTHAEFDAMKQHTVNGSAILEGIPALKHLAPIARNHHERWDGRGYPDGLSAEEIPFLARVVAVADVLDALTSARPYREALPPQMAFQEIERGSGAHFDPRCVEAILDLRPRIEEIYQEDRESVAFSQSV